MHEEINELNAYIRRDDIILLFAEDFVNYILVNSNLPSVSSGIQDSRPLIYNAFNPTVKTAADLLHRRLEKANWREFEKITQQGPLNRDAFMNYATYMKLEFISQGFQTGINAQKLLHFCVKISVMAVKFYINGFREAPVLAVQCILNFLEDYDMTVAHWDSVNITAATYTHIYDFDGFSTPDSESGIELEVSSSSESDASNTSTSENVSVQETDKDDGENEGAERTFASVIEYQHSNFLEEKQVEALCSNLSEISVSPEGDCSKSPCLQNLHAQTSSDYDVQMRVSTACNSVFLGDEEYESDVFEESAANNFVPFVRQLTEELPLSSSSSQQSDTGATSSAVSATERDSKMSSSDSDSSTDTSQVKESPVRKHLPKARKN